MPLGAAHGGGDSRRSISGVQWARFRHGGVAAMARQRRARDAILIQSRKGSNGSSRQKVCAWGPQACLAVEAPPTRSATPMSGEGRRRNPFWRLRPGPLTAASGHIPASSPPPRALSVGSVIDTRTPEVNCAATCDKRQATSFQDPESHSVWRCAHSLRSILSNSGVLFDSPAHHCLTPTTSTSSSSPPPCSAARAHEYASARQQQKHDLTEARQSACPPKETGPLPRSKMSKFQSSASGSTAASTLPTTVCLPCPVLLE